MSQPRRAPRRGSMLLEVLVAMGLLAAGLSISAQVMAWNAVQQREMQRRQCAWQEAANGLERLRSLAWDDLTVEKTRDFGLSPQAADLLPGGKLSIDIQSDPGDELAKRIVVEVHWSGRAGPPGGTARLTAWRWKLD